MPKKYDVVIGLEVHCQIKTESKMFCSCPNNYGDEPNTNVCPVCMGYPGAMPVPNQEAVRKTIIAGLMCGCSIPKFSKFDRKSYFYPDMAKNYQISQYDLPFCLEGKVKIEGEGYSGKQLKEREIRLERIHLEEDAGKLTHFAKAGGVDYNRAGVPLMEAVSHPDMTSPDEAYAYLQALKEIFQYAGAGDCDMEKGQLRCDVNVSLKPKGQKELGTKIELKNMNSFRAVHRALNYEIKRIAKLLDQGVVLKQETRGWDDEKGESYLMRTKEDAHDYRYFPEPDIMPFTFTDEDIENFKTQLPELPDAKRERYQSEYSLTDFDVRVITGDLANVEYFEKGVEFTKTPKIFANWIITELLRELGERELSIKDCPVSAERLAKMVELINNKTISSKIGKTVLAEMFETDKDPKQIVEDKGLVQVTDNSAIEAFVDQAIADNQPQVQQYKDGNEKVIQFFVGQVMKLSRGKANPPMVLEMLKKKLND